LVAVFSAGDVAIWTVLRINSQRPTPNSQSHSWELGVGSWVLEVGRFLTMER
jgi:hypothetical protein